MNEEQADKDVSTPSRAGHRQAHDDDVVAGLETGLPIEAALTNAAQKHPAEALSWDGSTISDIAAHFDYLKEHAQIMRKMQAKKPK